MTDLETTHRSNRETGSTADIAARDVQGETIADTAASDAATTESTVSAIAAAEPASGASAPEAALVERNEADAFVADAADAAVADPAALLAEIEEAVPTAQTEAPEANVTSDAVADEATVEVAVAEAATVAVADTATDANATVEAVAADDASATADSSDTAALADTPAVAESEVSAVDAALAAAPLVTAAAVASVISTENTEGLAATEEGAADAAPAASEETAEAPAAPEKPRVAFSELNLEPRLQQGIDELGFTHCTPIQSEALPFTLAGNDVIGKAQTGTGKTAAFLITIIQTLLTRPEQEERYNGEPRALILAPTRELALQIEKDARPLLKHTGLNMVSIVGGLDYKRQQKRLQEEIIDIVVGTPGRLIDFVRGKDLFLSETEIVVIDEADRMLDMGFIPDVKRLVRETPYKTYRQTLLFSATFTQDIMNLAESWTREAVRVEIEPESVANASVEQKIYIVTAEQKLNVLYNLITQQNLDRVMVFVNRRDETRDLTHKLKALGLRVAMLSGEIPQHKRLRTLENFRNGRLRVMVATDVAGRGIHIEGISHVVNYTLPEDPEDYVHRIGRTGRAGATGTSVSFACEEDAFLIPALEKLLGGEQIVCTHPEPELLAELPELIAE